MIDEAPPPSFPLPLSSASRLSTIYRTRAVRTVRATGHGGSCGPPPPLRKAKLHKSRGRADGRKEKESRDATDVTLGGNRSGTMAPLGSSIAPCWAFCCLNPKAAASVVLVAEASGDVLQTGRDWQPLTLCTCRRAMQVRRLTKK